MVDDVVAYRTLEAPATSRSLLRQAMAERAFDAVVFTSGSTVRGLGSLAASDGLDVTSIPAICIGPETGRSSDAGRVPASLGRVQPGRRCPRSHDRLGLDATPGDRMTLDLDAPPGQPAADAARRTPSALGACGERRPSAHWSARPGSTRRCSSRRSSSSPGSGVREPIGSMPGVHRMSPDVAADEAARLADLGVGGVILFGLPGAKDALGTEASADDGIVQQAFRRIRERDLPIVTIADTCLCEYTDHGHCGPLAADGSVDNDAAVARLAEIGRRQARAGADIVAPSAMMDGQVAAIRRGPRRGRASARRRSWPTPRSTPRRSTGRSARPPTAPRRSAIGAAYQMDPANGREAMREMALDVAEGADILLVKPALPGLDLVAAARARFDLPIAAYQVSGRVRDDRRGGRARLARRSPRDDGDGHGDRPCRGGDRHHVRRRGSRDVAPGRAMSDDPMSDQMYIQALGLGLDPAWRRLSDADRHADGCDFRAAYAAVDRRRRPDAAATRRSASSRASTSSCGAWRRAWRPSRRRSRRSSAPAWVGG